MPGLIRKPGLRAPSPAIMQNSRSPSRFAHFSRDRDARAFFCGHQEHWRIQFQPARYIAS
jgi:hypothetical protein